MTSVRSHRLRSSGNKWLALAVIGLILGACSPKIRPETPSHKTAEVKKQPPPVVSPKPVASKVPTIALMLPFNLDQLELGASANQANLSKADLALDYYQGFKFALDSLTAKGYNYKLQVFDSKDAASQARSLATDAKVRSSDLIVGPVFPESVTAFASSFTANKAIVSPLSPAAPEQFKSNKLVTVIPPLAYHALAAAQYINGHIKPKRVFILRSGYSDENKYITPFHKAIDSLSQKKIAVTNVTVTHGNLDGLIPQLSATEENVFIVPATDELFLTVTLHSLQKLSQTYPVMVFGHPNWAGLDFLKPELLQDIKTHITTADNIDYKSPVTISFVKNYKRLYHIAPSEYAIKGFDEGYYFGSLISSGVVDPLSHLDKASYNGLYNQFSFIKTANYGWVNTHVTILQYQNFELKKVE